MVKLIERVISTVPEPVEGLAVLLFIAGLATNLTFLADDLVRVALALTVPFLAVDLAFTELDLTAGFDFTFDFIAMLHILNSN